MRTGDLGGELARTIADFEQQDQMTLMHRFNKAADLLDQVQQVRLRVQYEEGCLVSALVMCADMPNDSLGYACVHGCDSACCCIDICRSHFPTSTLQQCRAFCTSQQ